MNIPTHPRNLSMARAAFWSDASQLKRKLLVAGLSLALVCVAILGVLRVFESFSSNTISAWRLVLLIANAFFCVALGSALYARGRQPRRKSGIGLGR
ncbi:MAG: hypothetical protein JO137_14365 [Hyphomicrobiales bacterium]|nr:hypothetical protein [Hyphomicrobiales bacterium]